MQTRLLEKRSQLSAATFASKTAAKTCLKSHSDETKNANANLSLHFFMNTQNIPQGTHQIKIAKVVV